MSIFQIMNLMLFNASCIAEGMDSTVKEWPPVCSVIPPPREIIAR